jgi:hypothetical protein
MSLSPPWNSSLQEVFLSTTNWILPRKQCARCYCFSHTWVSFKRYVCFMNSGVEAYLELRDPISTLENPRSKKHYFQKLPQFSHGITCLMLQVLHSCFSLERYMGFFNSDEYTYLEQTEPISTLKHQSCRKESFVTLTQFSQGKNVLMLLILWHMVFYQKIHVFLLLRWIGLLGTKWAFWHLENSGLQEVFPPKTNSVLPGKQFARCSSF